MWQRLLMKRSLGELFLGFSVTYMLLSVRVGTRYGMMVSSTTGCQRICKNTSSNKFSWLQTLRLPLHQQSSHCILFPQYHCACEAALLCSIGVPSTCSVAKNISSHKRAIGHFQIGNNTQLLISASATKSQCSFLTTLTQLCLPCLLS